MVTIADPRRVDQERRCAKHTGRFGVLPFVADHKGTFQVDVVFESGLRKQTGTRFSARTKVILRVWADKDVIQSKGALQSLMHPIQVPSRDSSFRHPGLIRRRNQEKACRLQQAQRTNRFLVYFEVFNLQWRYLQIPNCPRQVQDPVSFQEYCCLHKTRLSTKLASSLDLVKMENRVWNLFKSVTFLEFFQ